MNKLKYYRERAGITIPQAAQLAGFKCESGWRGVETGRRVPQFAKIKPILSAVSNRGQNKKVTFEKVWED